jgi:hypothetical protein
MTAQQVLDAGFLDARARLLEVAALLDRVDRTHNAAEGRADFRYRALVQALQILTTATEDRAKALLVCWSDPTQEPRPSAIGLKAAVGAWDGVRP